ncbi:MAG: hypothetical protein KGO80_02820 [Bacteroidetes bacterium]|nr:hypothetical protein [Bacteroidota bacterium]
MRIDFQKEREKQQKRLLMLRDMGMGVVILGAGLFFLVRSWFVLEFNQRYPPDQLDKIFGIVCLLYGGWRVYRGYLHTRSSSISSHEQ